MFKGVSFRDDFTRQVYLMEENFLPEKRLYVQWFSVALP